MKKILIIFLVLLLLGIVFLVTRYYPQLQVANGYAAKKMCSCTFIADRDQEDIQNTDLGTSPLSLTRTHIDRADKSVKTSLFGLAPRVAVFRNQLGCILLDGQDDFHQDFKAKRDDQRNAPLPFAPTNSPQLEAAIDIAFSDSAQTRAVVVIHHDTVIAERYAHDFTSNTPINGWSMTKSISSTLIGILVKQGKLKLTDDHLFPDWKDDRKQITLEDLLQMQSGLNFEEDYSKISNATNMLFRSENVAEIALKQPLTYSPGEHWHYSSGTSNLLSQLIRNTIKNDSLYHVFPYEALFDKIGMESAILETDESGTFVGSSFCFATPRDWGKLGLLYLHEGSYRGVQIVDSSWVDFVRKPASTSEANYGGHFWLNQGGKYEEVPRDMFSCNGFQGQFVFIFPSHDLVIVRMGLTKKMDFNRFLASITTSLGQGSN